MSHFAVMVITKDIPNNDVLTRTLQPWHEFECTGCDDEYVVDIDETEERRAEYESATVTKYRDKFGTLFDAYADRFYREWTAEELKKHGPLPLGTGCGGGASWISKDWGDGRGYRSKVHFIPEGFEEIDVPSKELMTFSEYLERDGKKSIRHGEYGGKDHKYGYAKLNENGDVVCVVKRTNPNRKWDWWTVGGRYSNRLIKKNTHVKCDSLKKSDIDFDTMLAERKNERIILWNESKSKYNANPADSISFEEARAEMKAHTEQAVANRGNKALYQAIDDIPGARELRNKASFEMYGLPDEFLSLEEFVSDAVPLSSLAIVKDGRWIERGEMGWWGVVHDEKDKDDWRQQFSAALSSVPDDHYITIIDCHI